MKLTLLFVAFFSTITALAQDINEPKNNLLERAADLHPLCEAVPRKDPVGTCHGRGHIVPHQKGIVRLGTTLESCANFCVCDHVYHCKSFSWIASLKGGKHGKCHMFPHFLEDIGYEPRGSRKVFYDRTCFHKGRIHTHTSSPAASKPTQAPSKREQNLMNHIVEAMT